MRITIVSRAWPSHERSGVTLTAAEHVCMLASVGHDVSIIGSHPAVLEERLPLISRTHVPASGSGALYSPVRVDRDRLTIALRRSSPDVVIVEAWQTALTDAAVEVSSSLGIPTLMISHGSSLHPFRFQPMDVLRSWAWAPYKWYVLPKLVGRLSVLTTLDTAADSPRFYDRDIARRLGVPVLPLVNAPVNWTSHFRKRDQRKPQVLVVGYFSPIKNQLDALEIAFKLPASLYFIFVGRKQGRYFERCVKRANALGFNARVAFVEDCEFDLANEMSRSLVVLSTSVTEVLPLTLIEAMASGTPFVATPVGAVPSLRGGQHADNVEGLRSAVQSLVDDPLLWQHFSEEGRRQHAEQFLRKHVEAQLCSAVEVALREGPRAGLNPFQGAAFGLSTPSDEKGAIR